MKKIAIIGGGPAGLMAAEAASGHGFAVHVYERKASVGRKFLIAGRGGLNLTHAEPMPAFITRFGDRQTPVAGWLQDFDNAAVRAWCHGLGIDTFVGSSGRVFPADMKAAPLLRAWLRRLRECGVQLHTKHEVLGLEDGNRLRLLSPDGDSVLAADAVIFALGGGSWPQLGSDGSWQDWLSAHGLALEPLQASNCGFEYPWSDFFREKHAGAPLKPLRIRLPEADGDGLQGECVVSAYGIEGSLVYALGADIRTRIRAAGACTLLLDLLPDHDGQRIAQALAKPRKGRSLSDVLRRQFRLSGVKTALLYELTTSAQRADPAQLARSLKALPLAVERTRPIAEAISSAGGVMLAQLDETLMWRERPGLFFAGEMLDWDAPTGGYLLTASMASGRRAGLGAVAYLQR